MAILTRTAANFRLTQNSQLFRRKIQLGEAAEPGQSLYLNTTDNKYWLASNDTLVKTQNILFAANYGDADDYIQAVDKGEFQPGATVAIGQIYAVATAGDKGEFLPFSELASSAFITLLAYGKDAATLQIMKTYMGVQKP